ncbi:hypothetical protein COCSADRAFT_207065 [Bipolaris sorokiniana ND90Pr]|uniref:Uncharacterized protein n=1 Tax=Cochliobolus sativus (strain ND90Pr / ATCC 201652) TaxID=665912 RepID=M2SPN1_COCSN|nr:uncharacterized protein COCSADRAFT_207065 [Bipolaris sorokiniana ND90Pr]EMD69173.1 hypothetical protein COCSADRAFT_207065 [Bipolaris sorokiniana ND90Pr]
MLPISVLLTILHRSRLVGTTTQTAYYSLMLFEITAVFDETSSIFSSRHSKPHFKEPLFHCAGKSLALLDSRAPPILAC